MCCCGVLDCYWLLPCPTPEPRAADLLLLIADTSRCALPFPFRSRAPAADRYLSSQALKTFMPTPRTRRPPVQLPKLSSSALQRALLLDSDGFAQLIDRLDKPDNNLPPSTSSSRLFRDAELLTSPECPLLLLKNLPLYKSLLSLALLKPKNAQQLAQIGRAQYPPGNPGARLLEFAFECQLGATGDAVRALLTEGGDTGETFWFEGSFGGSNRTRAYALRPSNVETFLVDKQCSFTIFQEDQGVARLHLWCAPPEPLPTDYKQLAYHGLLRTELRQIEQGACLCRSLGPSAGPC